MNYSPKLKQIAEEIKEILDKHDVGGIAVLHEPGFAEYLFKLNPSYSAITYTEGGIRVKGGKDQGEKLCNTSNLLRLLADVGGNMIVQIIDLSEQVDKELGAEHGPSTHTPHEG